MRTADKGNGLCLMYGRQACAFAAGVIIVSIIGLSGCGNLDWFGKKKSEPKRDENQERLAKQSEPLPGTIGAACFVEGLHARPVQGYGLVTGLAGKGSSQCPERIRTELIETIRKYGQPMNSGGDFGVRMSTGEMIDSLDTAVVKVSGIILPGAPRRERFDVVVRALEDTGTVSLEGGWLMPCELRIHVGPAEVKSRILAKANGPISIDPFQQERRHGSFVLRRTGYVLGGGANARVRPLYLILRQPSYPQVRAIEQKILSVFRRSRAKQEFLPVKAQTGSRLELRIPEEYRDRKAHFLGLVCNLIYVRNDPVYIQQRAIELTKRILDPLSNVKAISLAWEAMGPAILPLIQPLYTSSNVQAVFYSARAGTALGDPLAVEYLGKFAVDKKSPYRARAIEQLGFCPKVAAQKVLREILNDEDAKLRILAYEGLLRNRDSAVRRQEIGSAGFILDLVSSEAQPMVYMKQTRQPRVALFGNIVVEPPVFYRYADGSILITADSDARKLSLICKRSGSKLVRRAEASLALPGLIRLLAGDPKVDDENNLVGLALPYSHIMHILRTLAESGAIPATFELEGTSVLQDQPDLALGRPERDD